MDDVAASEAKPTAIATELPSIWFVAFVKAGLLDPAGRQRSGQGVEAGTAWEDVPEGVSFVRSALWEN